MKIKKEFMILFLLLFSCLFGEEKLIAASKYTIKPGDTMWEISLRHRIELEMLIEANPQLKDPRLIYPGDTIFLPEEQGETQMNHLLMLELLNRERVKANLQPLQIDESLMMAAEKKSIDMREKEYVAHKSPTYGNPNDMLEAFRIPFRMVRESIGAGPKTSEEMFDTWVNSPVNQKNILDKNVTHVGIGYAKGGLYGHYWTIILIEKEKG